MKKKYLSVFMLVSSMAVYSMQSDESRVRNALERGIRNCRAVQRSAVLITTDDSIGQTIHRPAPRSVTPPLDEVGDQVSQATPWTKSRVRSSAYSSQSKNTLMKYVRTLSQWQKAAVVLILGVAGGMGVNMFASQICSNFSPEKAHYYFGCGIVDKYAQMFGW